MPGLHICWIAVGGTDARGEWISLANDGAAMTALTELKITDETRTQQRVHIYTLPAALNGSALMLAPGATAFVFTGHGQNERTVDGDLLLFAGRGAATWNNNGDVAYLRRSDGTIVDWMDVGAPPRHPNGHRRR